MDIKEYRKLYYQANRERLSEKRKHFYQENKEKRLANCKRYRDKNKDKIKQYREENKEKYRDFSKKYQQENKENLKTKRLAYEKRRAKTDPHFKLRRSLRHRLRESLKYKKWNKNSSLASYIGCDKETLKKYFESKFLDGMSWENHGEWHIDHIVPLSSARTEEELYRLCHYTNLQPLWAIDNLRKSDKVLK